MLGHNHCRSLSVTVVRQCSARPERAASGSLSKVLRLSVSHLAHQYPGLPSLPGRLPPFRLASRTQSAPQEGPVGSSCSRAVPDKHSRATSSSQKATRRLLIVGAAVAGSGRTSFARLSSRGILLPADMTEVKGMQLLPSWTRGESLSR